MTHSTSYTYVLKRKILTFTNKISRHLFKPEQKFIGDIIRYAGGRKLSAHRCR